MHFAVTLSDSVKLTGIFGKRQKTRGEVVLRGRELSPGSGGLDLEVTTSISPLVLSLVAGASNGHVPEPLCSSEQPAVSPSCSGGDHDKI